MPGASVPGASVREAGPADAAALDALYTAAFPDEDLAPLVRALLDRDDVASLVAPGDARESGPPVGHVALSACRVGDGEGTPVTLLGPLAIAPAHRRRGIGTTLVRAGMERMRADGAAALLVLGDPAYYARHGFRPERGIAPPCPLPAEWRDAWQSIALREGTPPRGTLRVPPPWQRAELWGP